MMKIYEKDGIFMFINNGRGFGAIVDNGKVNHISGYKTIIEPTFKGWTLRSKTGKELEESFIKATLNYDSKWTIDGFEVEILQSGAGYYAGCFDNGPFGGPYCRISEYFSTRAEAAAWIWKNDPTMERE